MKLLQALALCLFIITACEPKSPPPSQEARGTEVRQLVYTKHARCRMQCRHIDETEIREILDEGNINTRKSDPTDKPCPTYAYEGYSHDNQHLRIVIARCNDVEKVVTCIDLDNEFQCNCK